MLCGCLPEGNHPRCRWDIGASWSFVGYLWEKRRQYNGILAMANHDYGIRIVYRDPQKRFMITPIWDDYFTDPSKSWFMGRLVIGYTVYHMIHI